MLARLDQDLAPVRASVDREGRLLRLDGSGATERVPEILGEMGYVAEPITDAAEVPRWFGRDEVAELSREEAHVLADRWMSELVAEGVTGASEGLARALRSLLFEAFVVAAETGEIGHIQINEAALHHVLSAGDAKRVARWISAKLGHG